MQAKTKPTKAPASPAVPQDATVVSAENKAALAIEDPEFFDRLTAELRDRASDSNVLLNIPIWGWTGDGKTCALLTAIHYCDPAQHPLGFALINDFDQLAQLENAIDEYKGLNVVATAAATTDRLRVLLETFIDKSEWPPGTDEASSFVLTVRNVEATLGYVVFPDIKGGSFRELDGTAREVLQRAHAAILLVSAETYVGTTTDSKRYRDEILSRLQRFASNATPVCVLLAKADQQAPAAADDDQKPARSAADDAQNQLTIVIERQKSLVALVCRVSVVAPGIVVDKKPPPASERHPDSLVKAWAWVVTRALCRPTAEIIENRPSMNIQAPAGRQAPLGLEVVSELRRIGEFSNCPGRVICTAADNTKAIAFTFISASGDLVETTIAGGTIDEPQFEPVGKIDKPEDATELLAYYVSGEFILGNRSKANFVWLGARGATLARLPLPVELLSWAPISARRIVGVDASGRLHTLQFNAAKWSQVHYVDSFIAPSPLLACAYAESSGHAFVYNGEVVEGIGVAPDLQLQQRVTPNLACKYDTPRTVVNRLGLCAGVTAASHVNLSAHGKTSADLGPTKPETLIAIAPFAPVLAAVSADLRLTAFASVQGKIKRTAVAHSPLVPSAPESVAWSRTGDVLVATFADKTWAIYRALGLMV